MSGPRTLPLLAIFGGVVLLLVGIVYLLEPAHGLPAFFPGHVETGHAAYGRRRVAAGAAAIAAGLTAFAYAWFSTGPAVPAGRGAERPVH
jgi:hypothetical protein